MLCSLSELPFADLEYEAIRLQIRPLEESTASAPLRGTNEARITQTLAALLAMVQDTNLAFELRHTTAVAQNSLSSNEQFKLILAQLYARPNDVRRLIGRYSEESEETDPEYWCAAIGQLSRSTPVVIAVDNADVIPFTLQQHILQCVDDLSRSLATKGVPVRFAITFRDENIPTSMYREHMTPPKHIQLSQAAVGLAPEDDSGDFAALPLSGRTLAAILSRRLLFAVRQVSKGIPGEHRHYLAEFARLVRRTWITQYKSIDDRSLSKPHIDLVGLTNESIRLALELTIDATFERLEWALGRKTVRPVPRASVFALRHEVIDWLFDRDPAGRQLIECFRDEHEKVIKEVHPCEVHRLLLTYLARLVRRYESRTRKTARVPIGALEKLFEARFGITRDSLRDAIFFLYHPENYEREFVSIFSGGHIWSPQDIESAHELAITRRGLILIHRVLQTPEYWSRLLPGGGRLQHLDESTVKTNAALLAAIAEGPFKSAAHSHANSWRRLVIERHAIPASHDERPFAKFQHQFALGDRFYMERVATSHGRYALELFKLAGRRRSTVSSSPRAELMGLLGKYLVADPPYFGEEQYKDLTAIVEKFRNGLGLVIDKKILFDLMSAILIFTIESDRFVRLRGATTDEIGEHWEELRRHALVGVPAYGV